MITQNYGDVPGSLASKKSGERSNIFTGYKLEIMQTISRVNPTTRRTNQAYIEGWKACARMKEAIMNERRLDVLNEVKSNFNRAQLYNFNKLAAEFAAYLADHYFMFGDDEKLGKKYAQSARSYVELSRLETIVITKYSELYRQLNKTRNPKKELIDQLRKTCAEFETYLTPKSTIIWIATYTLWNALAYVEQKYNRVIEQSRIAIAHLESKGIERTTHFYKDLTAALIRLGQYEEALLSIEHSIQNIRKGSPSWSVFLYYRVVIELHMGNYQAAYDIFQEAEKKRQINKAMAETWLVVKGYFKFLMSSGKLEGPGKFKLGKFLNDIEVFTADKSGQNTNVIILKIILRLHSDRDRIIDERQRIKLYSERYLEDGGRSRTFYRMLHQIVPGNFRTDEVGNRALKYLERMPIQKGYDGDLEVIPFEELWRLVLENLD